MTTEIHHAARKRKVHDDDINHAFSNALVQLDYDPDDHPPRYALVGPDRSGNMIELIAILADDDRHVVIHAMRARPSFLALINPGDQP